MKYLERALERKFLHTSSFFKAVLVGDHHITNNFL